MCAANLFRHYIHSINFISRCVVSTAGHNTVVQNALTNTRKENETDFDETDQRIPQ